MAPTAISPPYFWRDELKEILITASVAFIIKGEIPSARTGPRILNEGIRFSFFIRSFVVFPKRNEITHTAETACEITVARAAPLTPILNPKMNMGSRIILHTAPIITVAILIFVKPWVVINILSPNESITHTEPAE